MEKSILLHRNADNKLIGILTDKILCCVSEPTEKSTTVYYKDLDCSSIKVNEKITDIQKHINATRPSIIVHTSKTIVLPVDLIVTVNEVSGGVMNSKLTIASEYFEIDEVHESVTAIVSMINAA